MTMENELNDLRLRTVGAGLQAVKNVDQALQELGLVSYLAARMGEMPTVPVAPDPEPILKHRKNGKDRPIKAKRKGFWAHLTRAERSAEMTRRQAVARARKFKKQEKAKEVVEQHSGTFTLPQ